MRYHYKQFMLFHGESIEGTLINECDVIQACGGMFDIQDINHLKEFEAVSKPAPRGFHTLIRILDER